MFTGIVEATGAIQKKGDDLLIIARPEIFDDIVIGSSISVSGVCLSVVKFNNTDMEFNVVEETWNITNLDSLKEGDTVNLERSVRADQRLDGHIVQGHVEGVAEIIKNENEDLIIRMPKELIKFCVQKGSIAINGVSLTIASIVGEELSVALIPHTKENTSFGILRAGDSVNIERDIASRTAGL
jgi:riboflavin synthase